ncbi:UvrD-helicase domain-containing protein [Bradyrhizobium cosmicum]|uniref:DNA 3'-5' helicase II n=1 Tax=Bradyrhizobium cosmicum TaxID=1404864 RepID=A0AAI8MIZ5_9BRAD|nr:UvrD-helicase domain-containing protein [Bradyrhizobium cosmicum]BAL79319.1 putative ATP-dependent DNA helicase [Bradyrhizobium cosmicum]
MSGPGQWQSPTIKDEDVAWASELMGFGPNGFAKVGDNDTRLSAIKNMDTADFEACPGSGKTTLLVAKLAILANRWRHPRQGVCVLSHTNAARNEIGKRLSASPVSVALLRYPHFVGTIHSFVNEFLAVPWLRSKGNPVGVIDTQIALRHRMGLLSWKWKSAMERRFLTEYALSYDAPNYTGGDKGALTTSSPFYQAMVAVSKASSEIGYFCFDEMFVWANELLDVRPEVATALRERFPVVFVDEAQDNSELQASLLHRVFCEGRSPSRRQRFGDSNQAIYNSFEQAGASTDPFPSSNKFDLPRSYRFNQTIADKVKAFGVIPQSIIGAGPSPSGISTAPKPPIVFLFDDDSVGRVLPCYAAHLVDQFSRDELESGTFVAIAGVHDSSRVEPIPCSMKHYEPNYDAACVRRASSPTTFAQYLARARYEMGGSGNVFPLVFATASAVLRLAAMAGSNLNSVSPKSPHRRVLDLLQNDGDRTKYSELVEFVVSRKGELSKSEWDGCCKQLVVSVAEALADILPSSVQSFLKWPELNIGVEAETDTSKRRIDNLFSYPEDDPIVHVRLGSIHSVKGETHTATLVLESFYYDHHLSELKPWLLGARSGGIKKGSTLEGSRLLGRLRLHYVAMTRPSHLLCIAMRKDAFDGHELVILRERGWQIIECCDGH